MKKFALILSIVLNIVLAGSIGVNAKQESEVIEVPVEKIVEVEKEVEPAFVHNKYIIGKYEKRVNGDIAVEFSDYSWAIVNHEKNEYIFQPACMGDWDMQFDSFEDLKMAMATYFEGKIVEVTESEINQTEENEMLNPEKYQVIEKELNKLPTTIKRLLIDNGVEILIQDGILNSEEGKEVYGRYYWNTNMITMDSHDYSIEYALIHEIGHALDNLLDMRTEKIIASYENNEIIYENPHHNSSIQEYIAQGVDEYYKNTLNKNTTMYKELNKILGEYR